MPLSLPLCLFCIFLPLTQQTGTRQPLTLTFYKVKLGMLHKLHISVTSNLVAWLKESIEQTDIAVCLNQYFVFFVKLQLYYQNNLTLSSKGVYIAQSLLWLRSDLALGDSLTSQNLSSFHICYKYHLQTRSRKHKITDCFYRTILRTCSKIRCFSTTACCCSRLA